MSISVQSASSSFAADTQLASDIARAAGDVLLALQAAKILSGKPLGEAGDAAAHEVIVRALRQHRPEDAILSEEGAADPARLNKERVWIVDPLDGTREYSEARADWAVHVALAVNGEAVAGAVAVPGIAQVYCCASAKARGAQGDLNILVSRTRAPEIAEIAARKLGAKLTPMGSAGAKVMAVVRGEAHAYIHAGGQYEWDSAAPTAVAIAAGLHVSRLDGAPMRYNCADPYLPDLVVCAPHLWPQIRDAVKN